MSGRDTSNHRKWLRSLGALALAGALLLGVAAPAMADPGRPSPPDSGARPNPSGGPGGVPGTGDSGLPPGGQPGTPGTLPPAEPPVMGRYATQIIAEQQAVEMLGERLKETNDRLADLRKVLESARRAATASDLAVQRTEARLKNTAAEAYQDTAAVPEEFRDFASGLEHLAPGLRDNSSVEGKAAAEMYRAALELSDASHDALTAAEQAVATTEESAAKLRRQFEQRSADLQELRERNADALREAEEAANRQAERNDYDPGGAVHGLLPNPIAVKAVRYALAQLGKPYVWGDEGPDSFDCSGLVWAAYRFAGHTMQARTARAQYYSTDVVAPGHMLPGDLVFFGPDKSNPESIHHVGIYIGGNNIVHAPTAGDKVKISPIWWWEFFAATRVVKAVKAPGGKPKPKPTDPKPTAKPTPKPTTPKPGPSWSVSPKPTPSTPPSTPPTTPSTAPPSSSAPPSESPGTVCPTPSPSTTPTPTPTATPTATPDPCVSTTPASTLSDGETELDFNWVFLDPFQKSATIATRRRTRLTCHARPSGKRR